jgi:hypothetical protein
VTWSIPELRRLGAEMRDVDVRGVEEGFGSIFGLVPASSGGRSTR